MAARASSRDMSNPPSRSDPYPETSANISRQAQSIPPRPVASGSCTILKNRLNQKATVHDATDDECSSDLEGTVQSPSRHDHHKRARFQDILSQGDDGGEDIESPSKRAKLLTITWTSTDPPDVSNYSNQRMLELSYVTRRAFAARIRYGRLRSHELDLMKSIVEYKNEQSKIQINSIDLQISSLKDTLRDAGVDMESKECMLSKDNIRMFSGDDDDDEMNRMMIDFAINIYPLSMSAHASIKKNAVPNFIILIIKYICDIPCQSPNHEE